MSNLPAVRERPPSILRQRAESAEQRDPRAATQRVGLHSPTLPQVDEWDAEQAMRLGYLANVIAYRCVQIRANAGASIPLVAGRRHGDYSTIRENAAIIKLLGPPPGGPAPKLSARKLIRWTLAQEIVTGRRAWEIETTDGGPDSRPVAFWPLASAHLKAFPSKSGIEWFRLFEYGNAWDPIKLQPGNVFYGWDPSGRDFRQSESALQAARFDLSLVNLCDRYGIGFLRNNAVPAAIVTVTAFPDGEHRQRFMANWSSDFAGPENAGRVALNEVGDDGDGPVGDSIDVKILGLSQKDARLAEARKEALSEVAISLGVPWSKLDASGRTFDNAEVEDRSFYEETVLPDLTDLADDINMQLAPRLGTEVVWFDLRGVRALKRRLWPMTDPVALKQAGVVNTNEIRTEIDLEPIDGGDDYAEAPEPVVAPNPELPLPPAELPPVPDDDDERFAPAAEDRAVDPEAVEQRRTRIWRTHDAIVRALEGRWERAWKRLFNRQADATIARLTGKRGRQMLGEQRADPAPLIDPAQIFDQAFWTETADELAADLFDDTARAALTALAVRFGIDFDLAAPWVAEFIEARANQLAGQVTATTYDAIRLQLVEGVSAGESIDDLAKRIRAVFAQASELRATTIARTEVISAYNGAAAFGAAELPASVVAGQEWIATRDGRTRETHASADGQIVAVGEPFVVGISAAAYPGDPSLPASETVNCRCAVAFLTPDEFVEAQSRAGKRVEVRAATALLRLVDRDTDLLAWRRALEEVAA